MGKADGRGIGALLRDGERSFSFEFFPPKDEDGERVLWQSIRELEPLRPTFVSVTYGAGGATRDRTVAITRRIARETSMLPMAHLTCVGHTTDELADIVCQLAGAGVRNVLALRGDPPGGPGTAWELTPEGLNYASDLVAFIKATADLTVGVAAFPEGHRDAASIDDDALVLKAKHDAGSSCRGRIRASTSSGTSRPDSSTILRIEARFRIGMIPGMIGKSTPRSRARSTSLK